MGAPVWTTAGVCCVDLASNSLACDLLQHWWIVPSSSTWHGLGHSRMAHLVVPGWGNGLSTLNMAAVDATEGSY